MSSTGPNYASTVADIGTGAAWANVSNALTSDGLTADVTAGTTISALQWTGYGFSIPSTATILGIVFEVNRSASAAGIRDANVYLVKAGSQVGSNKALGTTIGGGGVLSVQSYGGSADLWGTTWTYSDINASNFGAQFGTAATSPRSMSVDYGRITVYYSASTDVTISATALAGTAVLSSATEKYDYAVPVSPLTSTGILPITSQALGWVQSVSPLTATGHLGSPAITAGGSVTFNAAPLIASGGLGSSQGGPFASFVAPLAANGVLSNGFVVIAECRISVGPLVGTGGMGTNPVAAQPLAANGVISPVNILAPPNLYLSPLPLVAHGVISNAAVGYGLSFGVSPLAALGGLGNVTIATNGNVSILAGPLIGHGTIPTARTWLNWTGAGLVYSIYANSGTGDGINYGSPIDETQSLSWTSSALAYPGDWKFGVRVSDLTSGLEEKNIDASIRLLLDSAGVDITNRPKAPVALRVFAIVGGGCRAEWAYPYTDRATRPTGFHVYGGPSGTVNYATVLATKSGSGPGNYSVDIPGFTDAATYSIGVRSFNATSEETNTFTVDFTADATGPGAVLALTAIAV